MTLTRRTDARTDSGELEFLPNPPPPDVQDTTFSLDVMGRFICNQLSEAVPDINAPIEFDVVVIGSGMYGAYCATKIFEFSADPNGTDSQPVNMDDPRPQRRPLRVLVLEAGPFLLPEHGQNLPDLGLGDPSSAVGTFSADAQAARNLVWGIGWRSNIPYKGTAYCVGGKSLFWGGWCPRLTAEDLAEWPKQVADYLTTARPDMDPLFDERMLKGAYDYVEYELGVKPADDFIFDPAQEAPSALVAEATAANRVGLNKGLLELINKVVPDLNNTAGQQYRLDEPYAGPLAVQTQSYLSGLFSLDKYSSLPGLISARRRGEQGREADTARRMMVVPNAHVIRLNVPSRQKDGQQIPSFNVESITLSYRGQITELKLKPTTTVILGLGDVEATRLALDSFPLTIRGQDELMGANLVNHLRHDYKLSLTREQFNQLLHDRVGAGISLVDRPQTAAIHVQGYSPTGRFHFQVFSAVNNNNNPDVAFRMVPDQEAARMIAEQFSSDKVNIVFRMVGELKGTRDGRDIRQSDKNWVDLSPNQNDPLFGNKPRAFVHYANNDPFQSAAPLWAEMEKAATDLRNSLGATLVADEGRQGLGTTWHEGGTLWIGDEPHASVTDINGRFHHVSNVACVGQAVFPTVGSANPVLTGMALALKTAEGIVDRYRRTSPPPPPASIGPLPDGAVQLWPNEKAKWKKNFNPTQPLQPNIDYFETSALSVLNVDQALAPGLGVIYFDQKFKNFRLTAQWMAFLTGDSIEANSGIFLRAPLPPASLDEHSFYSRAIEIQIDETGYDFSNRRFGSSLHKTGAVYNIATARVWAAKMPYRPGESGDGFWNTYEIDVVDDRVSVRLNGYLVSEAKNLPAHLQGEGFIGLQYHTGVVHFGNIRVVPI